MYKKHVLYIYFLKNIYLLTFLPLRTPFFPPLRLLIVIGDHRRRPRLRAHRFSAEKTAVFQPAYASVRLLSERSPTIERHDILHYCLFVFHYHSHNALKTVYINKIYCYKTKDKWLDF